MMAIGWERGKEAGAPWARAPACGAAPRAWRGSFVVGIALLAALAPPARAAALPTAPTAGPRGSLGELAQASAPPRRPLPLPPRAPDEGEQEVDEDDGDRTDDDEDDDGGGAEDASSPSGPGEAHAGDGGEADGGEAAQVAPAAGPPSGPPGPEAAGPDVAGAALLAGAATGVGMVGASLGTALLAVVILTTGDAALTSPLTPLLLFATVTGPLATSGAAVFFAWTLERPTSSILAAGVASGMGVLLGGLVGFGPGVLIALYGYSFWRQLGLTPTSPSLPELVTYSALGGTVSASFLGALAGGVGGGLALLAGDAFPGDRRDPDDDGRP